MRVKATPGMACKRDRCIQARRVVLGIDTPIPNASLTRVNSRLTEKRQKVSKPISLAISAPSGRGLPPARRSSAQARGSLPRASDPTTDSCFPKNRSDEALPPTHSLRLVGLPIHLAPVNGKGGDGWDVESTRAERRRNRHVLVMSRQKPGPQPPQALGALSLATPGGALAQTPLQMHVVLRGLPLQLFDFPGGGLAVGREVLFGNGQEPDHAPSRPDAQRLVHVCGEQRGVPLVGDRLQLAGQRRDGHGVGRIEVAAKQHAAGVGEGHDDGVLGTLVSGREVVGEIGDERVLVVNLRRPIMSARAGRRGLGGRPTMTLVLMSAMTIDSLVTRSRADEMGSRDAKTSP